MPVDKAKLAALLGVNVTEASAPAKSDTKPSGQKSALKVDVTKAVAQEKAKLSSSPGAMQRDYSVYSIVSQTTMDTRFRSEQGDLSLVMSPSLKFGLQKNLQSRASKQSIKEIVGTKQPFYSKLGDKNSPLNSTARRSSP